MQFKDISSNYMGKMLTARVDIDTDTIADVQVFYREYRERITNEWGVTYPKYTGLSQPAVHIVKMKRDGMAFTGGLGAYAIMGEPRKRKTIKALWGIAENLTAEKVRQVADSQTADASEIVG